jgi:hypothetical protein
MRRVDPPKLVHVHRDETWYDGWLEAWRQDDDGRLAYVRYTVGVGMQHLEWVGADRGAPGLETEQPPTTGCLASGVLKVRLLQVNCLHPYPLQSCDNSTSTRYWGVATVRVSPVRLRSGQVQACLAGGHAGSGGGVIVPSLVLSAM